MLLLLIVTPPIVMVELKMPMSIPLIELVCKSIVEINRALLRLKPAILTSCVAGY